MISDTPNCGPNANANQIVPNITRSTRSNSTSWIKSGTKKQSEMIRKLFPAIIAICFGIYGVALVFLVFNHFDKSIPYCSSIFDELVNIDRLYLNFTIHQNNGMFLLLFS